MPRKDAHGAVTHKKKKMQPVHTKKKMQHTQYKILNSLNKMSLQRVCLKDARDGLSFTCLGRIFHKKGPAVAKALIPHD